MEKIRNLHFLSIWARFREFCHQVTFFRFSAPILHSKIRVISKMQKNRIFCLNNFTKIPMWWVEVFPSNPVCRRGFYTHRPWKKSEILIIFHFHNILAIFVTQWNFVIFHSILNGKIRVISKFEKNCVNSILQKFPCHG